MTPSLDVIDSYYYTIDNNHSFTDKWSIKAWNCHHLYFITLSLWLLMFYRGVESNPLMDLWGIFSRLYLTNGKENSATSIESSYWLECAVWRFELCNLVTGNPACLHGVIWHPPRVHTTQVAFFQDLNIMSLNKKPLLQFRRKSNTSYSESRVNMKSQSLSFPSAFRKISDTRLNKICYSHTSKDDFQSGLLFPKLVFSKGTKNVNRVVNLNTACERKYRSWSDPSGGHTGDKDDGSPVQSVQICNDRYMKSNRFFVKGLRRDVNATRNNSETKSFCDTVSSYPCSVSTRSSMNLQVTEHDGEVCSISKRKTVLNWICSTYWENTLSINFQILNWLQTEAICIILQ